jgi:RNA-dependent RNA polymerase
MDRLLTSEVEENKTEWELIKAKMLKLVDIYYDALDAQKTGNKVVSNPGFIYMLAQTLSILLFTCWYRIKDSERLCAT